MKDHEFRELVNTLRDVATQYHDHESLRERIRRALIDAMKRQEPVAWTTNPPSGRYSMFPPEVEQWVENGWNVVPLYAAPVPQAPSVPDGWKLVLSAITEDMHVAAVKVLHRAHGVDGLPQRMLNAMLAAAPQPERSTLSHDAATAYGFLWHVNNEPGTPNRYSPERAAYEARRILRSRLSAEERGDGINRARELMKRSAGDERGAS